MALRRLVQIPHTRLSLETLASGVLRMFNRKWPLGPVLSPWFIR